MELSQSGFIQALSVEKAGAPGAEVVKSAVKLETEPKAPDVQAIVLCPPPGHLPVRCLVNRLTDLVIRVPPACVQRDWWNAAFPYDYEVIRY